MTRQQRSHMEEIKHEIQNAASIHPVLRENNQRGNGPSCRETARESVHSGSTETCRRRPGRPRTGTQTGSDQQSPRMDRVE